MIHRSDLIELAQRVNLSASATPRWDEAASAINEALYETCHAVMNEEPRTFADRKVWCHAIAKRADELAESIRSVTPDDGWAPYDMMAVLELEAPFENDVQQQMSGLLEVADPRNPSLQSTSLSTADQLVRVLARIAPSLQILALLAKSAEGHWAGCVQVGGKASDRARRHLMSCLCAAYHDTFGVEATVSTVEAKKTYRSHLPSGRSLKWFHALFEVIEARLPPDPGAEPLRVMMCRARTRTDALAHWISDATTQRQSEREKQP